jgi:hypothetical protein
VHFYRAERREILRFGVYKKADQRNFLVVGRIEESHMSCSLKPAGVASYSAASGTNVTIKLNSLLGGASMVSAVATPANGAQVVYDVAGDAFTFPVLPGITRLVMSFALSGVHESAAVVEDCGGAGSDNPTLAIIQTWNSSGFMHSLTIIGN